MTALRGAYTSQVIITTPIPLKHSGRVLWWHLGLIRFVMVLLCWQNNDSRPAQNSTHTCDVSAPCACTYDAYLLFLRSTFFGFGHNVHRYAAAVLFQAEQCSHSSALYQLFQMLLEVRAFQPPGWWDLALHRHEAQHICLRRLLTTAWFVRRAPRDPHVMMRWRLRLISRPVASQYGYLHGVTSPAFVPNVCLGRPGSKAESD